MGKIFRLHSGADGNVEHWKKTSNYLDHNVIDTIKDPSGLSAMNQITSIPTPFARMDLVKSAFLYVTSKNFEIECLTKGLNPLDGKTIYHKLISDALDVAEIFYNIEAFQDKVEILEWNSGVQNNGGVLSIKEDSDLGRLLSSPNKRHKLLGETLEMFIKQDSDVRNKENDHFNFSEINHIYLLNYKAGPEKLNVIGGTSPTTLFFTTANDLSYVDIGIGNDKFFDEEYCPLFRRSKEFIKWIYQIQNQFPDFSRKLKGLNEYLLKSINHIDKNLTNYDKEWFENSCKDLTVNSPGNIAEILGFNLKTKKYDIRVSSEDNDFIIASTKKFEGDTPCILPIDPFNMELNYGNAKWQKDWYKNVPKYDPRPLTERTLPNQSHIKYPYLTVSDLLEPYLIKVPYPIDTIRFFDGNYNEKPENLDHGFMLPIKKEIFKFFSIDDLKGQMSDGKKMMEIKKMPGGALVILRIPIKGKKYIEISRSYVENVMQDRIDLPDEIGNIGVISEHQFTIAIYPFIKIEENINPHYRLLLAERDLSPLSKHLSYTCQVYKLPNTNVKIIKSIKRSDKNQKANVTSIHNVIESQFDIIEIINNRCKGLIVPNLINCDQDDKKFKFAVDFGTTNTHIEYNVNEGINSPFEIEENENHVGSLHITGDRTDLALRNPKLGQNAIYLTDIIDEEFIPAIIGDFSDNKFPQRTSINDNGKNPTIELDYAIADFNIPFWYFKENRNRNSVVTTNLKWSNFNNTLAERRTRAFIKQLMIMMRNKVLVNGGRLNETTIVWFFPSSMPIPRKDNLQKIWSNYYKRYFGDYNKVFKISESFAPFYYYTENEQVRSYSRPAINIDIGGGTSDVVIFDGKLPLSLTSFRFAGNSIFGDGYGGTIKENGFVQKYFQKINDSLQSSGLTSLITIHNTLLAESKKSSEVCEFYLSLENNQRIKKSNLNISFSKYLHEDKHLRLVFLYFYSSIIYHIAKFTAKNNNHIPEFITFSGNGSKFIPIINGSDNLSRLSKLTEMIYSRVYNEESNEKDIKIKLTANPKEITCKGGLEMKDFNRFDELEEKLYKVMLGDENGSCNPSSNVTYDNLNEGFIDSIVREVKCFNDLFFNLDDQYKYSTFFDVEFKNKEEYKKILTGNIRNDIISGIEEKNDENSNTKNLKVEESLFFYAIKGNINRLAYQIYLDNK